MYLTCFSFFSLAHYCCLSHHAFQLFLPFLTPSCLIYKKQYCKENNSRFDFPWFQVSLKIWRSEPSAFNIDDGSNCGCLINSFSITKSRDQNSFWVQYRLRNGNIFSRENSGILLINSLQLITSDSGSKKSVLYQMGHLMQLWLNTTWMKP